MQTEVSLATIVSLHPFFSSVVAAGPCAAAAAGAAMGALVAMQAQI